MNIMKEFFFKSSKLSLQSFTVTDVLSQIVWHFPNFLLLGKMFLRIYLLAVITVLIVHYSNGLPRFPNYSQEVLNKRASIGVPKKNGIPIGGREMHCDGKWKYYRDVIFCGGIILELTYRVFEYHC